MRVFTEREPRERISWHRVCLLLLLAAASLSARGQKVKVGYDKSADFSKYKTYAWTEPAMPPTRPLLWRFVVNSIDVELEAKGLQHVDKDGQLILIPEGGIDFGIVVSSGTPITGSYSGPVPSINATMWTGTGGQGELAPAVGDATLRLQFVDRSTNQIVWSGAVNQKLDPDEKAKSLELASKAVSKLLKKFPSNRSPAK